MSQEFEQAENNFFLSEIAQLRDTLLNETVLGIALLSLPMVMLSVSRIFTMEWRPVFALQMMLLTLIWILWFQRNRVSYVWRLTSVLIMIGLAGLSAYAQHGPAAIAGQFSLLIMVIAVLFADGIVALGIGILLIISLLSIAWGAINGILPFDIDYQKYARSPTNWALIILATAGYGGIIARLVWRLFHRLVNLQQQLAEVNCQLVARNKEAFDASHAKSTCLATMSHEIRTPLNAIIGMTYLLSNDALSAEQAEEVQVIQLSSKNLLSLINDFLDFSKIEAGELKLDRHPFALPQLLDELKMLATALKGHKNIRLNIAADDAVPSALNGDGARLYQMLLNFLSNAIKFTQQGQISLQVKLMTHDEQANTVRLRFEVKDTGIGITPEILPTIFQAFKQADSSTSRRFGGTGLGLSIVKRLADMMDGEVGNQSQPGVGSTFWLELPFDIASPDDVLHHPYTTPASTTSLQNQPRRQLVGVRALLVDDSLINLDVCQRILAKEGVTATLCESGLAALAALQKQDFDIVLMDLQMPDMDGFETARQIRAQAHLAELPIVAFSANVSIQEHEQALAVGMNDFLPKPIDPPKLMQIVSALVMQSRLESPTAHANVEINPDNLGSNGQSGVNEADTSNTLWPTIAGIDAKRAAQILGGDSAFFIELLTAFVKEHTLTATLIRDLLAENCRTDVARLVHKLQGQALHLGAIPLAETAACLEATATKPASDTEAAFQAFEQSLASLLAAIGKQIVN